MLHSATSLVRSADDSVAKAILEEAQKCAGAPAEEMVTDESVSAGTGTTLLFTADTAEVRSVGSALEVYFLSTPQICASRPRDQLDFDSAFTA